MRATTGLVLIGAVTTAAVLAGCGTSSTDTAQTGSSTSPAATTSQPTVTATVVPPTTTTTAPASASGPVACATANLTVSLGTGEGAAGSIDYPIHFTNKGTAACTITAYPGVSVVGPTSGIEVGPPAARTGAAGTTITLSPGAEATSLVAFADYLNFPAASCAAAPVSGFRVYPPNNKAAAYVPFPAATKACTTAASLQVQPVVAGAGS